MKPCGCQTGASRLFPLAGPVRLKLCERVPLGLPPCRVSALPPRPAPPRLACLAISHLFSTGQPGGVLSAVSHIRAGAVRTSAGPLPSTPLCWACVALSIVRLRHAIRCNLSLSTNSACVVIWRVPACLPFPALPVLRKKRVETAENHPMRFARGEKKAGKGLESGSFFWSWLQTGQTGASACDAHEAARSGLF